ncbi:hypothetical protein LCGC14_2068160 [marine sediment metagenome]|uniref:Uncharacterized protein n=1 Tax=marine sediment metagenome TaxID=412755 RepID=A0A0F9F6J7_9ZZZZ
MTIDEIKARRQKAERLLEKSEEDVGPTTMLLAAVVLADGVWEVAAQLAELNGQLCEIVPWGPYGRRSNTRSVEE